MASTVDAVIYVGPHDEVEPSDAPGVLAQRDVPVKVGDEYGQIPADVAMRLLEQRDNWAIAPGGKATTAKGGNA
jgi:hypothetical protein